MSIKGAKENKLTIFRERFSSLRGDMTQADFAKFIGISRPTVGFYENGDRLPDALALKKIAEKCDVSTDWLLGLSDVRSTEQDKKMICETIGLSEIAVDKLKTNQSYFEKQALNYLIVNDYLLQKIALYFFNFLYEEKNKTEFAVIYTPKLKHAEQILFAIIVEALPKCKESVKRTVLKDPMLLKRMILELLDEHISYSECYRAVYGEEEGMEEEQFDNTEYLEDTWEYLEEIAVAQQTEFAEKEMTDFFDQENFLNAFSELLEYKENKLKKRGEQNANNHTEERDV